MSRISALPVVDWRAQAEPFRARLTALLKTPGGSQSLRLAQAGTLLQLAARRRGVVVNGRVGIGKTLSLALGPTVVRAQRPLFVTLGGILRETKNHVGSLREHWQISPDIVFTSYTVIGNLPRKDLDLRTFWHGLDPDFVGCDEVDRLANMGAAVTQMIGEWRERCPDATFMPATANLDLEGLVSYAHTMRWGLGDDSPCPLTKDDVEAWASVLDEGDLLKAGWVCQDLGIPKSSPLPHIRRSYRQRLHTAPGFIIDDTPFTAVPLTVTSHALDVGLEAEFERLRTLGQKPDGIDVLPDEDGAPEDEDDAPALPEVDRVANGQVAQVARQLGRGFFYKMDPLPPPEWAARRRRYFGWVRAVIEEGLFKTEAQARAWAISNGKQEWLLWAAIKPSFVPTFRTVWLSTAALDWAAGWADAHPHGIVWTEHTAVGLELAARTGLTFYHGRGLSASGQYIEKAPAGRPIIASRPANSVGRNLQYKWKDMLFVQPVSRTDKFEQATGRVHREGLETWAPRAHADVLLCCTEDVRSVTKTLASAERTNESIYSQKATSVQWSHVKTRELPQTAAFA
jgi:hypothetical protein